VQGVSVVVVSNGRPDALRCCLLGLSQIDHANCELIVVAGAVSRPAIAKSRLAERIKTVACDVAKISVARNAGLGKAAGHIVAFIDDDAVPESTWPSHPNSPFTNFSVTVASGFLRSRNGIAFQLRARLTVLMRKHGATGHTAPHVPRAQQLRRLLTYMVAGRLMPSNVSRLLQTFDAGWADGLTRPVSQHPTFDVAAVSAFFDANPPTQSGSCAIFASTKAAGRSRTSGVGRAYCLALSSVADRVVPS
jgi:glycosyltransferase involved in cell wall biosynthesis